MFKNYQNICCKKHIMKTVNDIFKLLTILYTETETCVKWLYYDRKNFTEV